MTSFKDLEKEESYIAESIVAARKIQTLLWGEYNKNWGLEEWRRMFSKRNKKIENIDTNNPHAVIELKKRLLQNAALSIALLTMLDEGKELPEDNKNIPSNLPEYAEDK